MNVSKLAGREEELCVTFDTEDNDGQSAYGDVFNSNHFSEKNCEDLANLIMRGRYYNQFLYQISKTDAKMYQELKKHERELAKKIQNESMIKPSSHSTSKRSSMNTSKQNVSFDVSRNSMNRSVGLPSIRRRHNLPTQPMRRIGRGAYSTMGQEDSQNTPANLNGSQDEILADGNESDLSYGDSLTDLIADLNNTRLGLFHKKRPKRLKSKKTSTDGPKKAFKLDVGYASSFSYLFRRIGDIPEKTFLARAQLTSESLLNYLMQRYPEKIAQKIITTLDFGSYIDFHVYVQAMEALMNRDLDDLYFFAHKLYDFNNDGNICSDDLFELFMLSKQYKFLQKDFENFFHYRPPPQKPSARQDNADIDFRKKYFKKPQSYIRQMESHLTNEEDCNYVPKVHNKYLRRYFEAQKNLRKLPQTLPAFRKFLANERMHKKIPSNKLTETYKSLNHLNSEISGEKRLSTANPRTQKTLSFSDEAAQKVILPILPDMNVNVKPEFSNEFYTSWNKLKIDMSRMLEIFPNDIPLIVYDIIAYMTNQRLPTRVKTLIEA